MACDAGNPRVYLQNTLYTKVVLALLSGRSVLDVLDAQRVAHLKLMRDLTARKMNGDLADALICDHALFHLEADLRWLELAAARLDEFAEEGCGREHDLLALSDERRSSLRRTEFGFVFQFGQLVPELSCLENVALPLPLSGIRRKRAEAVAAETMRHLEVDDLGARRPGEVSGGQAQRVAVARALVTEPKVAFADEPTGALDSLNGERVMKLLVNAARELGAAVVLVTHEPRVAAYSDREVVVRDGKTRAQVVPA